jgi:hypothetical protein
VAYFLDGCDGAEKHDIAFLQARTLPRRRLGTRTGPRRERHSKNEKGEGPKPAKNHPAYRTFFSARCETRVNVARLEMAGRKTIAVRES